MRRKGGDFVKINKNKLKSQHFRLININYYKLSLYRNQLVIIK